MRAVINLDLLKTEKIHITLTERNKATNSLPVLLTTSMHSLAAVEAARLPIMKAPTAKNSEES